MSTNTFESPFLTKCLFPRFFAANLQSQMSCHAAYPRSCLVRRTCLSVESHDMKINTGAGRSSGSHNISADRPPSILTQSLAGQVDLCIPSGSLNISVISQPKWLKFGLQAHFLKMFGHTKFQLSITFTFRIIKLKVEVFSDFY